MRCEKRRIREQSEGPSRMAEENIHNIGKKKTQHNSKNRKKKHAWQTERNVINEKDYKNM